jgi:hypothetical protein
MDPHVVIADTHHMTTSGGLSHLAANTSLARVQLGEQGCEASHAATV